MRILVVGSGGREHALTWALAGSPQVSELWCAPGNPGIAELAPCIPIEVTNIKSLVSFALLNQIDLVVPGPEAALAAGLSDAMAAAGIACCGPSCAAAQLEASKSFTKQICDAAGVPTAKWQRFDDPAMAREYVHQHGAPLVVKADGLAAGKGVVVASSETEAVAAIDAMMQMRSFGKAGATILIEECLTGEEVSLFALCDGKTAIPFGVAKDHKRVGDGDVGLNTGGMGAYSPVPIFTEAHQDWAMEHIIRPTLAELAQRGIPYRGILYAGLMLTADGLKLIEFNARFGDPECQALVLRMESDLLPALRAACFGELSGLDFRWKDATSIAVVLAAKGYPEEPEEGSEIRGLRNIALPNVEIFHAATETDCQGRIYAAGGRVLTVGAIGDDIAAARSLAYTVVDALDFPGGFCRRDIGWRVL